MRYIESWLTGLGLQDIIPKLEKHGITTPKKLAALTLKEMYEVVGVEDAEDRKKLYFLIQRLQTILNNKAAAKGGDEAAVEAALPAAPAPAQSKVSSSAAPSTSSSTVTSSPPSSTTAVVKPAQGKAVDPLALSGSASEEDLRVLRRKRRASVEPLPPPPPPAAPAAPSSSATGNAASAQPPQAPVRARPGTSASTGADLQNQLPRATPSVEPTLPARRESTGGAVVNHSGSTPLERYGAARSSRASTGGAASVASSVNSLHSLSSTGALSVASSLSVSTSLTSSVENLIRGRKVASNEAPASAYIRPSSPIAKSDGHAPSSSSSSSAAAASSSVTATTAAAAGRKKDSPPRPRSSHAPSSSAAASAASAAGKTSSQPTTSRTSSSTAASSTASRAGTANAKSLPKPSSSPVSSPARASPPGRSRSETGNSTSSINSIPPPPPPPVPETDAAPAPFSANNASPPQAATAPVYVEDMAIRVVVRKRPLSSSEVSRGDRDVMEIRVGGEVHVHEPKTRVDLTKVIETTSFAFDDSFDDCDSNETIYSRTVRPLVEFAFEGGKSSCFAYGQTGSGKTFSLMGSNPHDPASCTVNAGLYVLAARDIFALRKSPAYADKTTGQLLSVVVSCFEIYGGKLFDLLNERNQVKCLEDARGQVQVLGLTDHTVESVGDLLDLMSIAHEFRSVGSTGANAESSRSHLIMQLTLKAATQERPGSGAGRKAQQASSSHAGKLSFIDLAGSERGADTTHNNKQTRMEGAEINTSLLALKEVIRSLERKHGHTPFRGSKLTQVLKDSFVGEKTRTCMIACVSPANTNCEHSLNTLRYADRVKEHQAGGGEESGAGGNNGSSPYSAPHQPRDREETARPATASSAPTSRENRRNSLGSDGPAAGSKAAKAPTSRYSSAGAMAPIGHMGHSPVRAAGGAVGGNAAVPKRPSTAGNAAPAGAGGIAANKRPTTGGAAAAPTQVPAPFPLAADKEKEKASPSPVLMHHPALSSSPARSAAVAAAAAASSTAAPAPAPAPPPVPVPAPKSGLQALAAAGTRLLQGKLGIGSSSDPAAAPAASAAAAAAAAAAVPVKKHSINLDLEECDEDLSSSMSKVTIHSEGNKNVALVSSLEAEGIKKTLSLLSAHKRTIAETVEAMKEEMELVQGMESAEERDAEKYVEALESVLRVKAQAVAALRIEVDSFRKHRAATATQREGR